MLTLFAGSDPRAGTLPSVLDNTALLTSVSLYALTHTVLSSGWIYAQNPNGFRTEYTKAATDAPLLYSLYEYNVAVWPKEYVEKVGNLVLYTGTSRYFCSIQPSSERINVRT
jgi:hypothetical protein